MPDPHENKPEANENKTFWIGDFYVDVLGSLVPGIFASSLAATVLTASGKAFLSCFSVARYGADEYAETPAMARWLDFGLGVYGNIGLLLVVSYVLGSVFYRQDPKSPDFKSARHIWRRASDEDRNRLAVQPRLKNQTDLVESDAQFPYYFIKEYLNGRGLGHLAKWIRWNGTDHETWHHRTKMYINILKIRLQYAAPNKCKEVVRNEAHVRMATSVWYSTVWIIWSIIASIVLLFAGMFISHSWFPNVIIIAFSYNIMVFIFVSIIKSQIERFIHYLRVREIVYVLESADFASRNGINLFPGDFV